MLFRHHARPVMFMPKGGLHSALTVRVVERRISTLRQTITSRYGAFTLPPNRPRKLILPGLYCSLYRARAHENRPFATSQAQLHPVTNVAVLGGGITGLASAYYLTKAFPQAVVTIIDKAASLGGWIRSHEVETGDGTVIFEQGPRSLRPNPPNGTLVARMIEDIGLADDLITTPRTSPAAQNRFIYHQDRLVRMPGPPQGLLSILWNAWSEPMLRAVIKPMALEHRVPARSLDTWDESVGSFITRRFSRQVADNFASAVFHGIYAGDIWQLSANSLLPVPYANERRFGSLSIAGVEGALNKKTWSFCDDVQLRMEVQKADWNPEVRRKLTNCSVLSFKYGVRQLVDKLITCLMQNENVVFKESTNIGSVRKAETGEIKIESNSRRANGNDAEESPDSVETGFYSHVISTLPAKHTHSIVPFSDNSSGYLTQIQAVTVAVVNFYFDTPNLLKTLSLPGGLPNLPTASGLAGFGYLIPNTIPFSQNPERALGVIFDSDVSPDSYSSVHPGKLGTRLTVMLGGHWWDNWSEVPDESEATEMALSVLERHLGITQRPVVSRATIQKECIPQYKVGHVAGLQSVHNALLKAYDGQFRVAGSSYSGVGVNDCVRAAYDVVRGMIDGTPGPCSPAQRTGLEKFAYERPMALIETLSHDQLVVRSMDRRGSDMGYLQGKQFMGDSKK